MLAMRKNGASRIYANGLITSYAQAYTHMLITSLSLNIAELFATYAEKPSIGLPAGSHT
jgi:hypothetical protein